MSEYDPTELVDICESILADGEISGEELYRLAEWLNEHREACHVWPGSLLVRPLQEAWEGGKVNKTEMRAIARVLVRIRKGWAKMRAEMAVEDAIGLAEDAVRDFDLQKAVLPQVPFRAQIRSHSDRGIVYEVDLEGPSCSCPDWRSYRKHLPVGHLSRCCKHIFDAFTLVEPQDGWPAWLGAFMETEYPPSPQQEWRVLTGRPLALASTASRGWANADVEVAASHERFGYHLDEQRWAYGCEPPGAGRIARAMHGFA